MKKLISLSVALVMTFAFLSGIALPASAQDGMQKVEVAPNNQLAPAESIIIGQGDSGKAYVGDMINLWLQYLPEGCDEQPVTWKSSDTNIATVDEGGNISCLSKGTVTITATTDSGLEDSFALIVNEPGKLNVDELTTVKFSAKDDYVIYKFTAPETGPYLFRFTDAEGLPTSDYYMEIKDSLGSYVNGIYEDGNVNLDGGMVYTVSVMCGFNSDDLNIKVSRNTAVRSIEIVQLPARMEYYEYQFNYNHSGLKVKVTFEDDTVIVWDYDEDTDLLGYDMWVTDDISYDEDGIPKTYKKTFVSCGGSSDEFTLNILPTEVESITIISAPSNTYIYGDLLCGYLDWEGNYVFAPEDLTGFSFVVNYKEGYGEQFTDEDIDMADRTIWGDDYYLYYDTENITFGQYPITFKFKGVTAQYYINLVESNVESIEVVTDAEILDWDPKFMPLFTGLGVKINYKDGTHIIAYDLLLNAGYAVSNYTYELFGFFVVDFENMGLVGIYTAYDSENDEYYYNLLYYGATCEYRKMNLNDKMIESITVDNPHQYGNGSVLNIEYMDGSKESITLTTLSAIPEGNPYEGKEHLIIALSEKGALAYYIECHLKSDENKSTFYYHVLGDTIRIDVDIVRGDVNFDEKVSVNDAIIIFKHLSGKEPLKGLASYFADLTGDEQVTIVDALAVFKHISGKEILK